MSTQTYIVFDVSNVCHRSWHVLKDLSHDEQPTGAVFGLLRDVLNMRARWPEAGFVFCFDGGNQRRREVYPEYKANRKKPDIVLQRQIKDLAVHILPALGYPNVFVEEGFEADDLIASVVTQDSKSSFVIVSNDWDLTQLIEGRRVVVWNSHTKSLLDEDGFKERWEIGPLSVPAIKSIAGCSGDDVPGVPGVGVVSAIQYLRGKMSQTTKRHLDIEEWCNSEKLGLGMKLVKLPFKGTPRNEVVPDQSTRDKWIDVLREYGMSSLVSKL